jgi:plastocyanin
MYTARLRVPTVLAVIASAGLVLVGCGSSSSSGKQSSGSSTPTAPVSLSGKVNAHGAKDVSGKGSAARLEVEADDFYFNPTYVKAAPGQAVTLELKNEGQTEHTFTIDSLGIDQDLAAGATKEVAVTIPESGPLQFHCRFHGAMGMQGAFYTGTGSGTATSSTTAASTGSPGSNY